MYPVFVWAVWALETLKEDSVIIGRVAELADKHGVSMTEVSLAWLLKKVTSPVVGATKPHHIEGAAKDSWFSHLAVEISGENASTEWCEPVADEEYEKL